VLELEIRLRQLLLLRLLEEILRAHVRRDGVDHDADQFRQLIEKDLMRRAELFERRQFDDGLHLAFEEHGEDDEIRHRQLAKAGRNLHVVRRHLRVQDALLFERGLADQRLAKLEVEGRVLAGPERIRRHLALDRAGQGTLRHRRGHLGNRGHLRRQVGRELIHVVGEILPGTARTGHLGLTAEFALGADLARDARGLGGERRQLVDHRIHGGGDAGELARQRATLDFQSDALGKVTLRDGPITRAISLFG
jgi:hypothetical protein